MTLGTDGGDIRVWMILMKLKLLEFTKLSRMKVLLMLRLYMDY